MELLDMISSLGAVEHPTPKTQVVARILQLGYIARAEEGVTTAERNLARSLISHLQDFARTGRPNPFASTRAGELVNKVQQRLGGACKS